MGLLCYVFPPKPQVRGGQLRDLFDALVNCTSGRPFVGAATMQKCGSEFFLRFSLPKVL